MKNKIMISILTILLATLLVNTFTINASIAKLELEPGVSLFGPYGEGHSVFIKNPLVNAGEIHTVGWGALEPQEGVYNWSEIDNYLSYYTQNGKKAAIRIQSAGHSTRETPRWLYDNYGVRQVTGQGVFFDFSPGENATQISQRIIGSGNNEYISTRKAGTLTGGELVVTSPGDIIESANHINKYESLIGFDFRGTGTLQVIIKTGTAEKVIKSFNASSTARSEMFMIPKSDFDSSSVIIFRVSGNSTSNPFYIDNVSISANAEGIHNVDRNLAYPDFFDPIYTQKYTNFIKAFAQRYRSNQAVGAVVVGGFGRWDELSMLGDEMSENNLHTKQWRAYGYDDDKFISHIDKMCQLFKNEFGDSKEIILHVAAFSLPATGLGQISGDSNYVGYAVNNLAKKYGFTAKTNGLTEKMTEWGQAQNGYSFFANRYKYDENTKHILETGIQLNHPMAFWMGHPISFFNRFSIDGVDNLWLYSGDLKLPFVMKYAHSLNEQAGNTLFTRSYNILMRTPFRADATNWDGSMGDRMLRNIWNGIYLTNKNGPSAGPDNNEHASNYSVIGGRQVLTANSGYPVIRFSLDDRQSYNTLYGSTVAVTYYDTGTDNFTVRVRGESGTLNLGTITKTNSNMFKTVQFYAGDFFDTKNNGDVLDITYDIEIDRDGTGTEYIDSIEINSVPSPGWKEQNVYTPKMPVTPSLENLTQGAMKSFEINTSENLSSIDLHIGTKSSGYVKFEAKVFSINGSTSKLVTTKEYFMPGENDRFRLPVANADYKATKYRVELRMIRGSGYILKDTGGNYAYTAKKYTPAIGDSITIKNGVTEFSAHAPFFGINIPSSASANYKLQKAHGTYWADVYEFTDSGNKNITFEPQTAGQYRIMYSGNSDMQIKLLNLSRKIPANPATRYNLGSSINPEFKRASNLTGGIWEATFGFQNIKAQDDIWQGSLAAPNPSFETTKTLEITPETSHVFHIIIKNETAGDMIKVYWKNRGDSDFSEEKMAYIPIVPNDTMFREYSYPIGQEASRYLWTGSVNSLNITNNSTFTYADKSKGPVVALKVLPVTGETVNAGKIAIVTMSLKENDTMMSSYKEKLNVVSVISNEETVPVFSKGNLQVSPTPISGSDPGSSSSPSSSLSSSSSQVSNGVSSSSDSGSSNGSSGEISGVSSEDSSRDSDQSSGTDEQTASDFFEPQSSGESSSASGDEQNDTDIFVVIFIIILCAGVAGGFGFVGYKYYGHKKK